MTLDPYDVDHATAVHESGHAVVAIYLGRPPVALRIHGPGEGHVEAVPLGPSTSRLIEQAQRTEGVIRVAGNLAVRHVLGDEAAVLEGVATDKGEWSDHVRATHHAGEVAKLTGETADQVLESFESELNELFAIPEVGAAISRVAEAVIAEPEHTLSLDALLAHIFVANEVTENNAADPYAQLPDEAMRNVAETLMASGAAPTWALVFDLVDRLAPQNDE